PGGSGGLPEPRGGLRPSRPRGPGLRRPPGHHGRVAHGRHGGPRRPARPGRQRRRPGLGPEPDPERRRRGRSPPPGRPEVRCPLHLGGLRPPPPGRLPPGDQGGRGAIRAGRAMKALVTGAGGFVGQALVAHLGAAGDEVAGLDRVGGPDITDAGAVRRMVEEHRPDAVYHLAAVTHIGASWDAPLDVFRINAEGTLNVLSACSAAGVGRVLVVASADEYGAVRPEDLPLTEEAPLRPLTPYGASKV